MRLLLLHLLCISSITFIESIREFSATQSGLNQYVINAKGSSQKPLSILCLYDSQNLLLKAAFWTAIQNLPTEPKNCEGVNLETWKNRTEEVFQSCHREKCVVPAEENGGHWLVCYSCHTSRDEKLTTSTNQEEENKLSEAVEFGTNMLNELLLPPWTMSDEEKKFESIQEALAFVQVSEMIAGKILSILPPGQKATLSIDKVSTILLQTIPESHKTRFEAMVDETTIKLPIPKEVKDASGVARIAVISYKAESALTREAFDAQAMATVSFFNSSGEKIKGRTKGSSLPLPQQQHIELAFSYMKQTEKNVTAGSSSQAKCVFYDLQRLKWSPKGCQINEAETACLCHHLTHFGLLLRPLRETSGVGLYHEKPLRLITVSGCCISSVALLLSIGFLIYQGKSNDRIRINKHFCLNLLAVELLMIFGINQNPNSDMDSQDQQFNPICLTLGIALHWTLLTTFIWSLLAGFQIYLLLVVIFETESRMQRYRQVAYGVPSLIILAAVIIDQLCLDGATYMSNHHCWMNANLLFISSFLVPVCTIVLINMGTLSIAIYRVCQLERRSNYLLRQARGLLSLSFILGSTWLIGVFGIFHSSIAVTYIFTTLNSLQGLFIFIFHVLWSDACRQLFRHFFQWFTEEDIKSSGDITSDNRAGKV